MPIDLDKLEALAKAATHLPWKVSDIDDRYITDSTYKRELAKVSLRYKPYYERAAYIVEACNAVPELITENRALREKVLELDSQRDWLARQRRWLAHEILRERIRIDDSKALFTTVEEWIKAAEQAAKEAGE